MKRTFRLVSGVCYPDLLRDSESTSVLGSGSVAKHKHDQEYYYDTSIMLSDKDVADFEGKPICVEHKRNLVVGDVCKAWIDTDKKMRILAKVYTDHVAGKYIDDKIMSNQLRGFSVGYEVLSDEHGRVIAKPKHEITLCGTPFFEGSGITVTASDKSGYKKTNEFCFKITAMSGVENTTSKDAQELARLAEQQQQQLAEQSAKIAKFEELQRQQEEREKKQIAEYGEAMLPKLQEVLEHSQQEYQELHGEGSLLPAEYRDSITAAFRFPSGAKIAEHTYATVKASKQRKELLAKREAELEELKKVNTATLVRINAQRETSPIPADMNTDTQRIPVEASNSRIPANRLFNPNPSKVELQLMQMDPQTAERAVSVNASASTGGGTQTPIQPVPDHKYSSMLSHSIRHSMPAVFSHAVNANFSGCETFVNKIDTGDLYKSSGK
jgi:hypothetical protein